MKNFLKLTFITAVLALFTGCETGELELLVSPNSVTVDNADPNFVLNDIQISFNGVVGGYSAPSRAITRQIYQFGTYNNAVDETTLRAEWATSYQMFANNDLLQGINDALAEEGGIPYHVGVGQVIEAFAYMLLVDYVGNVPFTQANQPTEFPNPMLDSGAEVYAAQLELLDEAIANFNLGNETGARVPEDLFYGSFDADNWIALANTLKIRAYLNISLVNPSAAVAGINAAASSNIIDTNEEDFQFLYGTTDTPDSRHPFFVGNYVSGAGQRMSNNFYDYLNAGSPDGIFPETGIADPRLRYYIYRQTGDDPTGSNIPCEGNPTYDYCYVGNGYWGRDHADDEGLPNDARDRSVYGIYPGGGAFDNNAFIEVVDSDISPLTLGGAGVRPIYLASFTHFALAEAALTIGTSGNAAALLELGIRRSMNKVRDFAGNIDNGDFAMTDADINEYVARVIAEYNAANNEGKLAVIAREYYLAAWGNGTEVYNLYRRTGYPDLQAPIIPAGPFPRAFRYPDTEIDGNPNIQQQPATTRVFWDNNPAGFID